MDASVHKKDLEDVFWEAVNEVDPAGLIMRHVKRVGSTLVMNASVNVVAEDLSRYNKVIVLGIGKASARMAVSMEAVLGERLSGGCIVTKYGHGLSLQKIRVIEAGHPVPDENSVKGAGILTQIADEADEGTLLINLISGGGSSLFCLPADGISLEDKRQTTEVLLGSGATIDEINCVRKHISKVKGGSFARIAYPARLINLILSDVVGDRIDVIASGIAAPDGTTFKDALLILEKYSIGDKIPLTVKRHLLAGAQGRIPETPKTGEKAFGKTLNIIIGNNVLACNAALRRAAELGYDAHVLTTTLTGEASRAGRYLAELARDIDQGRSGINKPALLISGGETTVIVRGSGMGGRSQEMALAFVCRLRRSYPGARNIFFLSAGTDGTDGPTDAAGAFVTPELMEMMKEIEIQALDHLDRNDAYHFFKRQGLLFKTGPTHTNVCDIQLVMVV